MRLPTSRELAIAEELWDYLRLGEEVRPAECILVFGGHDLGVAHRAVQLYESDIAPLLLVSGGAAHVPTGSKFLTEAEAIADVLYSRGIPKERVLVERIASNTSENFWLSAELLRDNKLNPRRFLVVQKPYAERRTLATAHRRWPDKEVRVTSEVVEFNKYCTGDISVSKVLSMIVGEILRLDNYARSGLINGEEPIPDNLIERAHKLQAAGFSARLIGSGHMGRSK
jgi:uncharacterized SAM-binding protein YcdF (DUF218 family)